MISVVVCARNEAANITDCLVSIIASGDVDEIVVVDGGSTDDTARIARDWGALVIRSDAPSLPHDRQLGIDAALGTWVALVDADHRIAPGDLTSLVADIEEHGWVIAQAGLRVRPVGFWNRAESEFLDLTHNTPGERAMVGVAPAVFHRSLFALLRFAETGVGGGDDTDLLYRIARDTDLRVGIGRAVVETLHDPTLRDYLTKWRWYGTADGSFMAAHPERRASMLFHLLVRYPLVYPLRAIASGRWRAAPYAILQGLTRARYAI
jgi:glycosyltransferase involved in cell wall biosynthesis